MTDHTISVDDAKVPATLSFSPVFNCAVHFIDRHIDEGRADKIAIREVGAPNSKGRDVTYAELLDGVNRAGNTLLSAGIEPGERALMMVKDCAEFFFTFWGAIKAGIIPVPLNTLLRTKDYVFNIENSEAAAVIYSPEFAAEVEPAIEKAAHKAKLNLRVDGEGDTLAARLGMASPDLSARPASADDDCFWLYSSGSTGNPKGVVHTHKDIPVTCQHYAVETLFFEESDIVYSAAKLFFAYGLGNAMNFPLWVGAQAVLFAGPPAPKAAHDIIETYKPTLFFGVPTLYAAQLREMESAKPDLSSLRLCISAGEALPPDLLHRWKEKTGLAILDGIGTTEILHIFISNRIDATKPGTSGKLVPGYEARIVDENGNDVPDGEAGGLMIRGNSLLREYWRNPEKTAASLKEGWNVTGDTYERDAEGFFTCHGRSDDMLKVGGIWCSPVEIEQRLSEHPKVLEAAVVGRADDDDLIKPEAYVVLNNADDASDGLADELLNHCKDGLARYKYPRWINFVGDLPKTATGKIQRFRLRQD